MPDVADLNVAITATDSASATLQAVETHLGALNAQLRTSSPLYNTATDGMERMGAATTKSAVALQAHVPAAAAAATSTASLERALLGLGTSLNPLPAQFNGITNAALSIGGITPAVAGLAVGVGVLGAGVGVAVAASMQFQTAMGALRAILPTQEVTQFGGALGDLALTLGQKTIFSSTQAIEAMGNLARSGVSAENMLNGVAKAALDMAAAMGSTPKEAALTLGAAMREFNLPASDATHVANQFAAAVHVAGLNAEEMRSGVSRVAPVANAMGASLDDVISGMELLARSGMEAGRAGTTLAQIYEDVVNPRNKEAAALMQQLGFTTDGGARSFLTATGTVKPFADIIRVLGDGLKDLTPAQEAAATQTEFSRRAMQGALAAVNAYKNGGLDQLIEAQHNARDAASAMNERMDNLPGSMKQLQSSAETLAVQLGGDLSPAIRGVVDQAKLATDALIEMHKEAAKELPQVQRGAAAVGTAIVGPELAAAGAAAGSGAQAAVQAAGLDLGHVFVDAMLLPIVGPSGLLVGGLVGGLHAIGAGPVGEEAKRIGADFAKNVAAAILADSPTAEAAFGKVSEQLVAEFKGRGLNDADAREAAQLYMTAVGDELERQRPGLTAKAAGLGDAIAAGLDAGRPAVVNASARIASEVGAALQANKGNIQAAIADFLKTEAALPTGPSRTDAGPSQEQGVAQILERGNALKAVQSVLATLTPAEQAHYQVLLLAKGADDQVNQAETVLADMRARGTITAAQYAAATQSGALAQRTLAEAQTAATTAALGGALAIRSHEEALAREKEQALGGAVAVRDHAEALTREHEAALGGAVAIRDHDEALAREKEAALGGALAIRDHDEALQRQRESALGGALAIRDHEEALARDKEAALGGALAMRDHAEALERDRVAALGGYAGIQDHEDALNREKTAALGGEVGIRAHSEALNEEKIAALGGRAAILDHQAALQQLDNTAQQSQQVFATYADRLANYAKSHNANAVQISLGYANANKAVEAVMGELSSALQAQVKAAQNAGDAYGAMATALEDAGVGYQDIAGLINSERDATERLNRTLQQNVAYRQQQAQATGNANEAARQAAASGRSAPEGPFGPGGVPLANIFPYSGYAGGLGSWGTGGMGPNDSPFANPGFAAWYQANYAQRETFQNENATNPAALATVRPLEVILEQFTNRFMDSYEANQSRERDKLVEALSHAGETLAQRLTRETGAPTVQTNIDNTVQGIAQQALTQIEASMSIAQASNLEYVAQTQGATAALGTLGRTVDTNVTADEALKEATQGLTSTTADAQKAFEAQQTTVHDWGVQTAALEQGMDFIGASASRAGLEVLEGGGTMAEAMAAATAATEQWKLAVATATALMNGTMRNAGVAGGVTEKGLTYTQIMSGSQGGGGGSGTTTTGSNTGMTTFRDAVSTSVQQAVAPVANAIQTAGDTLTQGVKAAAADFSGVDSPGVQAIQKLGSQVATLGESFASLSGGGPVAARAGSPAAGSLSEQVSYEKIYQQMLEQRASSAAQSWVGTLGLTEQAMTAFVTQTQGAMAGAAYAGALTGHSLAELTAATQAATQALTAVPGATQGTLPGLPGTYNILPGNPLPGGIGGSNQGIQNLTPGNYYGLPVVSPVTGGSLRGFADGGLVAEPTYLTNARTGRTFGLMAEAGPERIGDGGTTITIQINANGVDALRDDAFWDQAVTRQIRPALKRVGVKV